MKIEYPKIAHNDRKAFKTWCALHTMLESAANFTDKIFHYRKLVVRISNLWLQIIL